MSEKEEVFLDEEFIVLGIPASTVEVKITAKIWDHGEITEVERVMPFAEVRAAIKEAQDGYIPSDAVFTLTDLELAELAKLRQKYTEDDEW